MQFPADAPLVNPPTPPPPSWIERILWFFPIVGWWIAGLLWSGRMRVKKDQIAIQMQRRSQPTFAQWGDDPQRRQVAVVVSEALKEEFDWPNAHYLPDDPLSLLIFRDDCESELVFVLDDVEDRLNLKRLDYALPKTMPDENTTLGMLVDEIVKIQRASAR